MREVHHIKDGKIVSTMINCGTDVLRYIVHEKPIPVTSVGTASAQCKTGELEIREVLIGEHKFHVAAKMVLSGTKYSQN